jgi:hypothetical protein
MKKTAFVLILFLFSFCVIGCAAGAPDPVYSSIDGDPSLYNHVTFDLQGGHINGNYDSRGASADYGRTIHPDFFPKDPQNRNYIFDGWFTGKYGTGNRFAKSTRVYTSFTVYARWVINE